MKRLIIIPIIIVIFWGIIYTVNDENALGGNEQVDISYTIEDQVKMYLDSKNIEIERIQIELDEKNNIDPQIIKVYLLDFEKGGLSWKKEQISNIYEIIKESGILKDNIYVHSEISAIYRIINNKLTKNGEAIELNTQVSNVQKDKFEEAVKRHEIMLGMTVSQVISSWGEPQETNKTVTQYGTSEQWIYYDVYIYFDDGIVTAWQE